MQVSITPTAVLLLLSRLIHLSTERGPINISLQFWINIHKDVGVDMGISIGVDKNMTWALTYT